MKRAAGEQLGGAPKRPSRWEELTSVVLLLGAILLLRQPSILASWAAQPGWTAP